MEIDKIEYSIVIPVYNSEKSLTETQWVRDSAGNVRKVTPEEAGRVAIIINLDQVIGLVENVLH